MSESISIIVPVYNGERHIKKCMEQLLNQTYKQLEILVINDGSTDKTGKILQEFTDSRIRCITQKNAGVSSARNKGLAAATGKYVCFVDSDDEIAEDYCEVLIEGMKNHPLAIGGYTVKKATTEKNVFFPSKIAVIQEVIESSLRYQKVNTALWNKMFDLTLIQKHQLRFNTKITIGEDMLFLFSYAEKINRARLCSPLIYVYYENEQGAMMKKEAAFNPSRLTEWEAICLAEKICRKNNWNQVLPALKIKKARIAEKLIWQMYDFQQQHLPQYHEMQTFLRKNAYRILFAKDFPQKRKFRVILNAVHPYLYKTIKGT
jgi:glycosyltransferase involved in cell wall biosynthesis